MRTVQAIRLSNLLPDGDTAFAPLSAAIQRDYDNYESVQLGEGAAFVKSISSDGAQGFNVTYVIDGRDSVVNLTADDWSDQWGSYFVNKRGANSNYWFNEYWLWAHTGSFYDDPNDRTSGSSEFDYFDINGWTLSRWGDTFEGVSVYGARTRPENLPTGSATYEGRITSRIWEGDDPGYPSGQTRVQGALALNADFDNSRIDGLIDGLETQPADNSTSYEAMAVGNTIDISNGVIADGRFNADWAGNDTDANSALEDSIRDFAGTMMGEFYGPAAEEVGGVMGGSRSRHGLRRLDLNFVRRLRRQDARRDTVGGKARSIALGPRGRAFTAWIIRSVAACALTALIAVGAHAEPADTDRSTGRWARDIGSGGRSPS